MVWLLGIWLQRSHLAKILSRPDLYEYCKASRRRSDKLLRTWWVKALLAALVASMIAALSYGATWSYREFGFVTTAIPLVVMAIGVGAVVFQYRKLKRSAPDLWDWWEGEIKE